MTPTTRQRTGSLSKTARLMILLKLREAGTLPNKAELSRLLNVSRFTIYRDLDDLDKLQPIYKDMLKKVKS